MVGWLVEVFGRCGGVGGGVEGDDDLFIGSGYAVRCFQETKACIFSGGVWLLLVVIGRFICRGGLGECIPGGLWVSWRCERPTVH